MHAGAVTVGKTNVPEFGAGIQSTNELFGPTRNPYDLKLTAGGSSGGAAAAVATGMVVIADGGDTGGSLRNPATFCNVVGLRPSVGSIPMWPAKDPFAPLSIQGPIGRTVDDVALQMSVLTRADPRSPGASATRPGSVRVWSTTSPMCPWRGVRTSAASSRSTTPYAPRWLRCTTP